MIIKIKIRIFSDNYAHEKLQYVLLSGQSTIAVYLDFSKTFDTINHEILMSKLQHNGIRDVILSWFKSYLSNRE